MRNEEFPNGSRTLRAKIDMASPNINMRDPVMYRILFATHHRTGDKWCIYPMYDWAHGQSDSIEGIPSFNIYLEFENHQPPVPIGSLMSWDFHHPQQIEFARLNMTYTVMSKRKLLQLVEEGYVNGWDDPGCRRFRAFTAAALRRNHCEHLLTGDCAEGEYFRRVMVGGLSPQRLNKRSPRVMAVLRPTQGGDRELPRSNC